MSSQDNAVAIDHHTHCWCGDDKPPPTTRRPWRPWEDDEPYVLRAASFPRSVSPPAQIESMSLDESAVSADDLRGHSEELHLSDPGNEPLTIPVAIWSPSKTSRLIPVKDLTRGLSPLSDLSEALSTPPLSPSLSSVSSPLPNLHVPQQLQHEEGEPIWNSQQTGLGPSDSKQHSKSHSKSSKSKGRVPCTAAGCNETFNRVQDMMRHLRNSKAHDTGDQVEFLCEPCSRSFPRKDSYRRHLKIKHGAAMPNQPRRTRSRSSL